jgi:hypothetical protein
LRWAPACTDVRRRTHRETMQRQTSAPHARLTWRLVSCIATRTRLPARPQIRTHATHATHARIHTYTHARCGSPRLRGYL